MTYYINCHRNGKHLFTTTKFGSESDALDCYYRLRLYLPEDHILEFYKETRYSEKKVLS